MRFDQASCNKRSQRVFHSTKHLNARRTIKYKIFMTYFAEFHHIWGKKSTIFFTPYVKGVRNRISIVYWASPFEIHQPSVGLDQPSLNMTLMYGLQVEILSYVNTFENHPPSVNKSLQRELDCHID